MCGIFGILNFKPSDLQKAQHALDTLSHRGRDQWGDWAGDSVYMGHRRLSIIDLSEQGRQPFVHEDIVMVVNGEIYNYKNLREELGEHLFRSQSDSEVILHGYRVWGIERLLSKLDGMYAIAVYDRRKGILHLAKDRWGKKPIFYARNQNQLIFASEIKAILEYSPNLRVFSFDGIKHWIAFRGSHSTSTIFHGIKRIPPATFLTINKSLNISTHKYYEILEKCLEGIEQSPKSSQDIMDELTRLLERAIRKRLMSDVPLGLQLSGGVDSSLLAGFMRRWSDNQFHTFSVVFSEPEYQDYSEESYSSKVARQWGYQHHSFGITKKMIGENFLKVLHLFDGMLDYPNAIPLYLLNLHAKQYISVALSGEAADELFGGYTKYRKICNLNKKSLLSFLVPDVIFNMNFGKKVSTHIIRNLYIIKKYKGNPFSILNYFNSYVSPETMNFLFGPEHIKLSETLNMDLLKELPFERQVLAVDHMTYLYSLLDRQDRTSMGANVEARLPFLDRELVEWAVKLQTDVLFDQNETKKPLKRLASDMYGYEFAYRRKMGFPLPLKKWMTDPLCFGEYSAKVCDDDFLLYQMLDKSKLENWLNKSNFDQKLINYTDSERMWMRWFLMVLRITQDLFKIESIVEE